MQVQVSAKLSNSSLSMSRSRIGRINVFFAPQPKWPKPQEDHGKELEDSEEDQADQLLSYQLSSESDGDKFDDSVSIEALR